MATNKRSRATQPRLKRAQQEELENKMAFHLQTSGMLKRFVRKYRKAIPGRSFELDFADIENKIGIEVQGGTWMPKMAHNSGAGIRRDCEKAILMQMNGWRVLPVTPDMIRDLSALNYIEQFYRDALTHIMPTAGIRAGHGDTPGQPVTS
jgi:very-short-patch-repair endonuclease